ncbi:response regulator [Desulfobacterales bacterium HSG16]|nr:response regulator [Desulfobacterales bacterium HSG16]
MNESPRHNAEKNIFIVDDKLPNLRVMSDMLKQHGYTVRGVPDGATALRMIHADIPDLILLDIRMPGMDGYKVCRHLKEDEKTMDIPVIFISAMDESVDKVKAFNVGGIDYITKPFQIEEVLARVETHLSLRDMNIRLRQEIIQRKKAEDALQKVNDELEYRVQQRTNELAETNEELKTEILERLNMEKALQKSEAQLRHAQKMEAIGTLAGGIAHDFNNILSVISGYAEIAKYNELSEGHPAHYSVEQIFLAAERATALVRQILAFSRQKESEPVEVGIHMYAKEVVKFLKAAIPPSIEIRHKLKAGSDTIMGDPSSVHQIMMNLCTNAAHAMREKGGILEVSTEDVELDIRVAAVYRDLKSGSYIKLIVSDTGEGMTGLVKDRIFDPYFTTKKVGEGTGLGLSVVHGIVKNHDGAIIVESEPGKGSTFSVFLPKTEEDEKARIKEELEPIPGGRESILVVDDEETVTKLLKLMLKALGYTVVAYNNPIEAFETFRQNTDRYDLVIADIMMPEMTGDRLAIEMMKIRSDIPIILCTGFSDRIDEESSREIGVKDFVMKPLLRDQIARTIRRVLDG